MAKEQEKSIDKVKGYSTWLIKMENTKINSKELQNNTAIMQIQLDQNDLDSIAQDLTEYASVLSTGLGYDTADILKQMTKDDLNHMISVFKNYFSDYVELIETDHVIVTRKPGSQK